MKRIALDHPFAALQGALGHRTRPVRRSGWLVAAKAAAVTLRSPSAPSAGALPQSASVPARPQAVDGQQAASTAGASGCTATARWDSRSPRALPWVEGLVLVLVMAYFGGGLVAILGGF